MEISGELYLKSKFDTKISNFVKKNPISIKLTNEAYT